MEYIIKFDNTTSAIKAEKCLLERKIQAGVLPLPSRLSAGCGICLRISRGEIEQALRVLADEAIGGIGLFSRLLENGQFAYTEIKDRSVLMEDENY